MNHPYRHPVTIGTAILGVTAMCLIQTRAAHACVTTCNIPTYHAGYFNSVSQGDIIGIVDGPSSEIYPIISVLTSPQAATEKYSHVAHNDYAAGVWITEDIFDKNQVTKNWDCTHPIDPYDMVTTRPGILYQAPADGNFAYTSCHGGKSCGVIIENATEITPWGTVGAGDSTITLIPEGVTGKTNLYGAVHGVAKAACSGFALYDGYESAGGYHLNAFVVPPPVGQNGTCVDFLTSFCGVPRVPARQYSQATALAATNAMYENVYSTCKGDEGWATSLFCSGACDRASDQFVNTFWYNSAWDTAEYNHTTGAPMVTKLSSTISPDTLMDGFSGHAPVGITATSYWITTAKGRCTVPGNCP